ASTASSSASSTGAPSTASEVAVGTGSSSAVMRVLNPEPITTPVPPGSSSERMPQILRPPTSTSLGHLNPTVRPGRARPIAAAIETPAITGNQPSRSGAGTVPSGNRGRSSTDTATAAPGGAVQARPSRP